MIRQLTVIAPRQGLHEITTQINQVIKEAAITTGLCTIFIQHTSASLLIQENADPDARHDIEHWLNKLVPLNDPDYTHTSEGPDDMPSHIKSTLTCTTLSIPVLDGRTALGTWQGIFLWEHRHNSGPRCLVVHLHKD
jgi:secondary thiamine-phosphate synthase enzyme